MQKWLLRKQDTLSNSAEYEIVPLKYLWNSVRDYKIYQQKEIQGLFSTLTQKVLFFKDFKVLKKV